MKYLKISNSFIHCDNWAYSSADEDREIQPKALEEI